MKWRLVLAGTTGALIFSGLSQPRLAFAQQLPLSPPRDAGQSVTPAFEGWYKNPDGTFSISFGYYNRNERETLEIPIGPNNFMSPADSNQGQPTSFQTGRNWGVFAVKVPADFGAKQVVWSVTIRGQTYAIPGSLKLGWEIDALGESASGNTPPVLRFEADGPISQGPAGIYAKPMTAKVGTPLALDIWATDEAGNRGRTTGAAPAAAAAAGRGAGGTPPTLAWIKHQGPGAVTFTPVAPRVDRATSKASATATFSEPGVYILRLRANDITGIAGAGHAQCCWTNGFVKVTVSR